MDGKNRRNTVSLRESHSSSKQTIYNDEDQMIKILPLTRKNILNFSIKRLSLGLKVHFGCIQPASRTFCGKPWSSKVSSKLKQNIMSSLFSHLQN